MSDRDEPVISALMPLKTYHEAYLAQAIQSVLAQTDPAWELLIVVEHSDAAKFRSMLAPWTRDVRIQMIENEGGRYPGAFNTGMRRAAAQFVSPIFADDLWDPEAVAVLRDQRARFPTVDFFHSSRRIIDDDGNAISSVHDARADVRLEDFREGTPVKHLLAWRRRFALALGGVDERFTIGPDDFDLPWTMAEHGAGFRAIDACLYIYRDHRTTERITTDWPLKSQVRQLASVLRKHGVSRADRRVRIADAKATYLRQCVHKSPRQPRIDLASARRMSGWRDTYR